MWEWGLDGTVEPVSEGCGPRALARLRGDPLREVEGAGATFSEEASHPGKQLPLPPPAPQPFLLLTFSLWAEEAEDQQTTFQGLGKGFTVLGFGFTVWE